VGYVNDPDFNRVCVGLDREPWSQAEVILRRYQAQAPEGPNPGGRHDPFPEILSRSAFARVELLSLEHDIDVQPSADAAIGTLYTLNNTVSQLGEALPAFEAEVRDALAGADTTPFHARVIDSALVGRRASNGT
jgi:hypothetical protein